MYSSETSASIHWGSILNRTTRLFSGNSSILTKKKSPSKHKITLFQQDGKISPNDVYHHLANNKIKALQVSKETDNKVTSDDNKSLVDEKMCTLNENTEINSSVLNNPVPMKMDGIDHNGIGVNYEDDDLDEIEHCYNGIDNTNVNKYSLNEYKLSQHSIASSPLNTSSTQFSKKCLSN